MFTPTIEHPLSSVRLIGIFGISPAAKPTTRRRPRQRSERIKALTGGQGIDVVYDPVGGVYTEPALRSLRWRGRLLVVGFAAGEIPKIPINLTLLKGCSIVGVNIGGFSNNEPDQFVARVGQLTRWFEEGKLRPHVSETMPLERAPDALARMAARQVQGKIVLLAGDDR